MSSVVLTWNVDKTIRPSSCSNHGQDLTFARLIPLSRTAVRGLNDLNVSFLMGENPHRVRSRSTGLDRGLHRHFGDDQLCS